MPVDKKDYSSITLSTYQKLAKDYEKPREKWGAVTGLEDKFAELVPKGGNILDVGCGGGHYAEFFVKEGFKVTGIDFSPALVRVSKKRVPMGKFIVMDMEKMSFPSSSFDGVWMSASLYHVPKKNAPEILKKVFEFLRPGCWLYISVREGVGEGFEVSEKFKKKVLRFTANYKERELRKMLSETGFENLKTQVIRPSRYTTASTKGASWLMAFAQKPVGNPLASGSLYSIS